MKLVTQTDYAARRFGDTEAVRMIHEAGFDGIDYSMFWMKDTENCVLNTPDYKEYIVALKSTADSLGITFEQSHAPFPPFIIDNEEYNSRVMPMVERAIEISGLLGVKVCVVHPCATGENQFDDNMKYYNTLLPLARKWNVKIAVENMWGRDKDNNIIPNICSDAKDFNRYVDALDNDWFTACLDLGHCGLVGENAAEMLKQMGSKRVTALHIHDNDNKRDSHTLPYLSKMKWDSILKAMAEIQYCGNFTFEADNFLKGFPDELIPACLKLMAQTGRYMIKQIEEYKVK